MTTVQDPNAQDAAAALRAAMVDELRDMDAITSEPVAAAIAAVPRHLFAPGEPLETAYAANNALVIKRDQDDAALSSLSAAHIQAVMLEQAEIEPLFMSRHISSSDKSYRFTDTSQVLSRQRLGTALQDPGAPHHRSPNTGD